MDQCPICMKKVSISCDSICCDNCDLWVHHLKCSALTSTNFDILCQANSECWHCPVCINTLLPFPQNNNLATNKLKIPSDPRMNGELKSLFSDLNHTINALSNDDNDDESETQFNSTSCNYYEYQDFNTLASQTHSDFFSLSSQYIYVQTF